MNDTIPALGEFIEPSPIRFIPEAPGWYALAGLFFILLLITGLLIWKHRKKNRYRRLALNWLNGEEKRLLETQDYTRLIYTADMLAKKISIHIYGRENTAQLRNQEWLDYLNKTCPSVSFSNEDETLVKAIYDPGINISEKQALTFTGKIKQWIKKHPAHGYNK